MYKYKIIKENLFHRDIGSYVSYGIVCIEKKTRKQVSKISDVSSNKAFVKSIAKRFTRSRLDPSNLLDAVELALC